VDSPHPANMRTSLTLQPVPQYTACARTGGRPAAAPATTLTSSAPPTRTDTRSVEPGVPGSRHRTFGSSRPVQLARQLCERRSLLCAGERVAAGFVQVSGLMPPDRPESAGERGLESAGELAGSVRARREQLGWSQSRLARASGVSRTVVNEVENGRRSPSLPTYDKLRRALGLDLASSLALLPTTAPAAPTERFLTAVAALLITAGGVELADAAAALQVDATAVRTAVAQLADRLAAVGVAAVDDGVTLELTVLAHAAQAVERIRPLEAVPTLTTEAVMTLVIVGHLGEATRRDIDERRGADSTSVLDRLAARGLLTQRTDQGATGRPHAYRLTTRALTLVGHSTLESFQAWCRQQITPTDQPGLLPGPVPTDPSPDHELSS